MKRPCTPPGHQVVAGVQQPQHHPQTRPTNPTHLLAGSSSSCAGATKLVLHYSNKAFTQDQAAAFCRGTHGASAVLPGADPAVLAAAQALVSNVQVRCAAPPPPHQHQHQHQHPGPLPGCRARWTFGPLLTSPYLLPRHIPSASQLPAVPGSPALAWSAAAWLGVSASPSGWVDTDGAPVPASALPWCPGEPNNKDGVERCTSLLNTCVQSGAAANDFPCDWQLGGVLCAFPSTACGEARSWTDAPACSSAQRSAAHALSCHSTALRMHRRPAAAMLCSFCPASAPRLSPRLALCRRGGAPVWHQAQRDAGADAQGHRAQRRRHRGAGRRHAAEAGRAQHRRRRHGHRQPGHHRAPPPGADLPAVHGACRALAQPNSMHPRPATATWARPAVVVRAARLAPQPALTTPASPPPPPARR
jgi:hypothetical protein